MDSLLSHTKAGPSESAAMSSASQNNARRRKNHRAGKKKKKTRRKSFVVPSDETDHDLGQDTLRPRGLELISEDFYHGHGRNPSISSLDSEALLDHREQQHYPRPRRASTMGTGSSYRPEQPTPSRLRTVHRTESYREEEEDNENAPLLATSSRLKPESSMPSAGYGSNNARASSRSSSKLKPFHNPFTTNDKYNVNYPPSVPGTPSMRPTDRMDMSFGDVMMRDSDEMDLDHSAPGSHHEEDSMSMDDERTAFQPSPRERRNTIALQAEEDVCFPQEGMSDIGDEAQDPAGFRMRARRRRHRWPDLSILSEWSHYEKEGQSVERKVKKITEPALINGRLRAVNKGWYRTEEDAPYRFTYFNEEFQSTIHSQTISELVQPGGSFRELFVPDRPILSDSEDSSDDDEDAHNESTAAALHKVLTGQNGDNILLNSAMRRASSQNRATEGLRERTLSLGLDPTATAPDVKHRSMDHTPIDPRSPERIKSPNSGSQHTQQQPSQQPSQDPSQSTSEPTRMEGKSPRYGDRPVWWLDILSPTEAEMKVLSKAFAIHPLTAEDIMVQEQREKVELFRHYYFVNYRTFDQDPNSENFLEPVNMYVVVFREGVLSFHFSMTPHPANVRRRIRQLQDYMILSSDWISYAIIDDITDVFFPLIQTIEDEVDDIDDAILRLHSGDEPEVKDAEKNEDKGGDMLRRVGDCRKKVMGLYRLLGNKADVIKGFAKRCNEHWEVAPRSEIGLYLGDIQDHIVTMTANLSHYEKILARSHANYLAQINIRMNERQEQTADVLGKLTVLGTIVLPMNIITGLWGMNVWVPGQEYEGDLKWFFAITGSLLFFGLACYWTAKRVYGIV